MLKSILSIISSLLFVFLLAGCNKQPQQPAKKPNIIFILVDTLRADHLSYAGYERETSPNIDKLQKESVTFSSAYAASSWTAPSVASIFTGVYPSVHGMMPPNSRTKAAEKFSFRLGKDVPTIAKIFKNAGYKTAGVSSNEWISEKFGFSQGFDYFFMKSRMQGQAVNEKSFRVIDKVLSQDQPFFLYIHYFDPHDPYKAPAPYNNFFQGNISRGTYDAKTQGIIREYDNEIRFVDEKIGELIQYLKSKNYYDDSIVVFTSDHGEQFYERGKIGHGISLHNEEINIPLLIKLPKSNLVKKVTEPVSHVDLLPTLLDLTKVAETLETTSKVSMAQFNGQTLSEHLSANFSSLTRNGILSEVSRKSSYKAVIDSNNYKVIGEYDVTEGLYVDTKKTLSITGYDLTNDPLELSAQNLAEDSEQAKDYFGFLSKLENQFKRYKIDTLEMDDATFNELKTLGYF